MLVSLILPTRGRAEQAMRVIEQARATTSGMDVELIVVTDEQHTIDHMNMNPLIDTLVMYGTGQIATMIEKLNYASGLAHGDWVMSIADDLKFRDGWLKEAIAADIGGFVGLNDLHPTGYWASHWIASRQFLVDVMGGVVYPPCYESQYADVEVSDKAIAAGVFVKAWKAIAEHCHYSNGKAPMDATYEWGRQHCAGDHATYEQRKAAGFPIDYAPVLRGERVTA